MPEVLFSGFCVFRSCVSGGGLNTMKKIAIFYNVTLGIFWEAVYVMVIIGVGSLFALAIQYIR